MKCAACKGNHDTVAECRACVTSIQSLTAQAARAKPKVVRMPTPGQKSLAQALGRERVRLEQYAGMDQTEYEVMIDSFTRSGAGEFITAMLKQPQAPFDTGTMGHLFSKVENGKYALPGEADGQVHFYYISGVRSRKMFELFGAPGDFRQRRIYRPNKILQAIIDDPIAAFELFGREVGVCGRCGSPLTQPHTRERGTGDICNEKLQSGRR